jgi:hypothetical protein
MDAQKDVLRELTQDLLSLKYDKKEYLKEMNSSIKQAEEAIEKYIKNKNQAELDLGK